jgi:hypothetical protein
MELQSYYINKTSDTSADTLLAVGFASMLGKVLLSLGKPSKGLTIEDAGPYYEVCLPTSIAESDLQHLKPFSPLRLLVTVTQNKKQVGKQGKQLDGFLYEAEQEKSKVYHAKFKALEAALRRPEARLNRSRYPMLEELEEPDPQLEHYWAIQQMRIASSFNDLLQRWADLEEIQREHIRLLLTLFGSPDNDIVAAITAWQKLAKEHDLKGNALVTALQLVNPTAGKGANRPKSSTLAEGNQDGFWLLELLKFVGFMDAAAPYVIRGSKDRKTYVLQPRIIELGTLQGMMRTFRSVCWSSTVVKLDIMAALRFAQTFVTLREQALKGQAEEDEFSDEAQLYSIAQGFEVLSFKDMGSAYATMNVSHINLPQWLPKIKTPGDANQALAILKEHLQIIQQIRTSKGEEGSEEYELLRFYRDFLSGHDLRPFWKFTTAYSSYLISQREHEKNPRRWIRQLSIAGLENLLEMNSTAEQKKLTGITEKAGFRRIAYAIRQSTVWAQRRRSQESDRTYEVRYGLGQELMREARYREKFIAALSTFLTQYNAETAREEEKLANRLTHPITPQDRRTHKLRGSVAYTDIDEIVALVDEFGSETVCSLLVAYGYASDPRKTPTSAANEGDTGGADTSMPPEPEEETTNIEELS